MRKYSNKEFGAEVANAYYLGFIEVFSLLRERPRAGQATPEYGKGVRRITHRKHRIFYVVRDDIVLIVRIVHHAQQAKRALKWTP
jgi:toxin ParE1/3/4